MSVQDLVHARQKDTISRLTRVKDAIEAMLKEGEEISVSAVAVRARVHRSFIYRHLDLRSQVSAAAETPPLGTLQLSGQVSKRSLEAENANLRHTIRRLTQRVSDLEDRLSEVLGEQAYSRTGLGAPASHAQLEAEVAALSQTAADLERSLEDCREELAASRETTRRLMAELNR